ncbi:MAG: YolD-like family protein [Ruminococcaceae bacterium]|nr:YolD-like family protein [Oscillospiraceae bacterium]
MDKKYSDIIKASRPAYVRHRPMSLSSRAAQFAPFEALNGHDNALKETARLTDNMIDIDEYVKSVLGDKLQILSERIDDLPEVKLTYFRPDKRKCGGAYISLTGLVKEIDEYERMIVFCDGKKIPIDQIYEIESELFTELGFE